MFPESDSTIDPTGETKRDAILDTSKHGAIRAKQPHLSEHVITNAMVRIKRNAFSSADSVWEPNLARKECGKAVFRVAQFTNNVYTTNIVCYNGACARMSL
jgi:hypothetical protein